MTYPFYCSNVSREVGEDLIGSATPYQTFILVECPFPWTANAFDSKWIPQDLRNLVASVKAARLPVQFLAVKQIVNQSLGQEINLDGSTRLLIYQRRSDRFCQGYYRYEWDIHQPAELTPLIQSFFQGQVLSEPDGNRLVRDLLVCVHGSHDKCCAKYGFPFSRQAIATIAQVKTKLQTHQDSLEQPTIRMWQTSHFGGHRFAPTLIDFPTGRYYGRMTQSALHAILTRSGDVQMLAEVYRGWSVLPTWLQSAERMLMFRDGWLWFDAKLTYQIIHQSADGHFIQAKLSVMRADGKIRAYTVEIVKDPCKTVCLRTSCGTAQESEQVKYEVKSFVAFNSNELSVLPFYSHLYQVPQ